MPKSNVDRIVLSGEKAISTGNHQFHIDAPGGYRVVSASLAPSADGGYDIDMGVQPVAEPPAAVLNRVYFRTHLDSAATGSHSVAYTVIVEKSNEADAILPGAPVVDF